jgi:hypothetical protein
MKNGWRPGGEVGKVSEPVADSFKAFAGFPTVFLGRRIAYGKI